MSIHAEEDDERQRILHLAAVVLAESPFRGTTLDDVARAGGIPVADLERHFQTIHDLGAAILTAEGTSMRHAQTTATDGHASPLMTLRKAFAIVARNLAESPIVRAGTRIALEAHDLFPERNIDPYRTWHFFIAKQLEQALIDQEIKPDTDVDEVSWLLVSAAMGTKDLIAFRGTWAEIEAKLIAALETILRWISFGESREPERL